MTSHRQALDRVMQLASSSRYYTPRMREIHEVAMYACGMTESQRKQRHEEVEARVQAFIENKRQYMEQKRMFREMKVMP